MLFYKTNRVRGYSLKSAREAELFLGGRLDAYAGNVNIAGFSDILTHLGNMYHELWLLSDNR